MQNWSDAQVENVDDHHANDDYEAIREATRLSLENEIHIYQKLPPLKRIIITEEEDPETGLPRHKVSNPLAWWLEHAATLPILARLARITLCVPATSAPSERLFSSAGLTIANDRAGLTPDNAADLVTLKSWWKFLEKTIDNKKRNAAVAGLAMG